MSSEPFLTKKEVATRLGVSVRTVERLNLPHLKVGRQNRYQWSEVEASLKGIPKSGATVVPLRPDDAA